MAQLIYAGAPFPMLTPEFSPVASSPESFRCSRAHFYFLGYAHVFKIN